MHIHVPKTAGTALRTAFGKQLEGKVKIFPHWQEQKFAEINPDDYDFYSGHIGFSTAKRLNGQIVTILRHPIDRFLSVYYFWRQLYETGVEKTKNTELAHKFKLEEFVRIKDYPGLIEEFFNRATFQIAFGSSLNQRIELRLKGFTENEIFDLAAKNLAGFKAVGIQENMGPFVDAINRLFGVTLNIEKVNVTGKRAGVSDIPVATRHAIQDWVYMDLELYQYAHQIAV